MNDELKINPIQYPKVMNKRNFAKIVDMMTPEQKKEIMDLTVEITEKVHGTNFRIGQSDGLAYIGTRKHIFTERISGDFVHQEKDEQHPRWSRMPDELQDKVRKILADMKVMAQPIQAFGELYGPGIQKGFNWHDEHYNLFLFEVKTKDRWIPHTELEGLPFTDYVEWSTVLTVTTMKDALQYDVESLKSSYSDDDFVEGIVITPLGPIPEWWSELVDARLIIKIKTKKYAEAASAPNPNKKTGPKITFVTEYARFVNDNRFEHVIQTIEEDLGIYTIKYEMKDLQILLTAVIADIVMEENSNVPLMKEDMHSIRRIIAERYSDFLDKRAEESLK